ncbi:hypothetical protein P7K49_033234 [Saguinus oedipus]|uniref:Uncharacterized protein n=1 Tax=Saguinus oedipus TaxID=9490 RepID=A0ABQ9TRB9_SAGOE|nr:hypothetical protein P7K49_033234 [Saguinus oedipus]
MRGPSAWTGGTRRHRSSPLPIGFRAKSRGACATAAASALTSEMPARTTPARVPTLAAPAISLPDDAGRWVGGRFPSGWPLAAADRRPRMRGVVRRGGTSGPACPGSDTPRARALRPPLPVSGRVPGVPFPKSCASR